jgi:formylglycine-generating enzyme required for sulfatase activity
MGNGWEWTSTPFGPFPGFQPMPNFPGYSTDFFDGRHYVMVGASWATDERLVRRSFRNWFQPHYPHTFAKFRCVYG